MLKYAPEFTVSELIEPSSEHYTRKATGNKRIEDCTGRMSDCGRAAWLSGLVASFALFPNWFV